MLKVDVHTLIFSASPRTAETLTALKTTGIFPQDFMSHSDASQPLYEDFLQTSSNLFPL